MMCFVGLGCEALDSATLIATLQSFIANGMLSYSELRNNRQLHVFEAIECWNRVSQNSQLLLQPLLALRSITTEAGQTRQATLVTPVLRLARAAASL